MPERVGSLAGGEQQALARRAGRRRTWTPRLSFAWSELTRRRTSRLRSVAATPSVRGRADDLVQLLDRVEAEGLHTMIEISLGDGFLGLHRVHEAQHRFGQSLVDQADFADRRDIVVRDACFPQDLQQDRARDWPSPRRASGPGNFSTKKRAARRAACGRRSVTGWTGRALGDVGTRGCRTGRRLAPARDDACATQGTSNWVVRRKSCLAVGSPMGQRGAIYGWGSRDCKDFLTRQLPF